MNELFLCENQNKLHQNKMRQIKIQYQIQPKLKIKFQMNQLITYEKQQKICIIAMMIEYQTQVCLVVCSPNCKIGVRSTKQRVLQKMIQIPVTEVFCSKSQCGDKVAKAIVEAIGFYGLSLSISMVAISMAGQIDYEHNILIESRRLESTQSTGNPYGRFDLAGAIKAGLKKLDLAAENVILVNDAFSPSLDHLLTKKIIITLALGNFPALGLSQKNQPHTNIYLNQTKSWLNEISLSDGKTVYDNLSDLTMKQRTNSQNCDFILQSVKKILEKYHQTFWEQPDSFVILGKNATVLLDYKEWPNCIGTIQMIRITDPEQSVMAQMRGALNFATSRSTYHIL